MTRPARRDADVAQAADALRDRLDAVPRVLLTLGSGLTSVADAIEDPVDVPVDELPGMPTSTVPGHRAVLRGGRLGPHPVLAQLGRVHLYEGHDADAVTRGVDVAAALGCRVHVVTNAAGGLDPTLVPGDLMVLSDHLNLTGDSPLIGVVRDGAPIFLDMAGAYDRDLRRLAHEVAGELGFELREGVYAGLRGPAYETPAEVAMLRTLGAQAAGMSTVLEVIAARSHGLRILGVSSVTNVHGEGVATSHAEVLEVGARAAARLGELLVHVIRRIPVDG